MLLLVLVLLVMNTFLRMFALHVELIWKSHLQVSAQYEAYNLVGNDFCAACSPQREAKIPGSARCTCKAG